jgi:hypothetical protein
LRTVFAACDAPVATKTVRKRPRGEAAEEE